jgi:multidrug efflux pump subunit AcrA (membrane-fusion protein)
MPYNLNDTKETPLHNSNLLVRSNSVSEIISSRPGFLVRWGMSIFLAIFFLIVLASFFIHYPDIIIARAKLTSINGPKELRTKTNGRLIALNVSEGQTVNEKQIIGFMECNAKHEEVISLSVITDSMLQFIRNNKIELIPKINFPELQNLGEVQPACQVFVQSLASFQQYFSDGYYVKKKSMLENDMQFLQRLHANILQQKQMQQQEVGLARQTFDANKSLKKNKVISELDYRNEKSKYIGKELSIPQINAALISNESSQHEKRKEILQLENEITQQKSVFIQALRTLKSHLEEWRTKYLLVAPIEGKIAFAGFLQPNQQLENNHVVCFIDPGNSNYYAEINIPQTNFGKVKLGQKVLLKLPAYPYHEFGSLEGKLDFVSAISTDSGYLAKVIFPDGLKTNRSITIQYKDGLLAQGEIVTDDLKLSSRLINEVKSIFTKR